jgi:hypothetical protein
MRQDPAAQVRFHFRGHEGGEHGRFSGRLELREEVFQRAWTVL